MHAKLPSWPGVEIESDELVWDGRFPLQRVRFRTRRFDGEQSGLHVWELWRRGRAAALLPYDPISDQVVLIEQFRLPALAAGLDPVLTEVPAGLCDPGESEEATVRREAVEETGVAPDRLERIGDFLLSPGGCDERVALFAGRIVAPQAGADGLLGHAGLVAEHEDIRVRVHPAGRAIAEALAGRMTNIVTTTALLWLAARRDWLRERWT